MSSVYGLVVFRPLDFFLLLNKTPGINLVIKSNAGALGEHFISRTGMVWEEPEQLVRESSRQRKEVGYRMVITDINSHHVTHATSKTNFGV